MRFEFKERHFEFPSERCILFGILNVTPDSFSDGGRFIILEKALEHALHMQAQGADAIDVGGESTRPGASPVAVAHELERTLPVIRLLKRHLQIPISIDTTKSVVAEAALAEGAEIVNDVSGLSNDPRMASVAAESGAGLILMHRRGTPSTMQTLSNYAHGVEDVKRELLDQCRFAVSEGVAIQRIALDPGIGFAKNAEQNWTILRNLKAFSGGPIGRPFADRPVMVGVSRKSFLGGNLADRGPGTLASELWSFLHGAHMIRTHDIAATRRALDALQAIRQSGLPPSPEHGVRGPNA